jgi:hypothetical protein
MFKGTGCTTRFLLRRRPALLSEPALRYDAAGGNDGRRCIMAIAVQQIHPVAHLPFVLGVLRRLEVATVIDRKALDLTIPPTLVFQADEVIR